MTRRSRELLPSGDEPETVSGLHPSRRRPGEVVVSFESGCRLRLPCDHEMAIALRTGETIDGDRLTTLLEVSDYETARAYALRLLTVRAVGSVELARKLRLRGHSSGTAERIAERMVEAGLIDDEAYAAAAARSIVMGKPAGARLVEQKLRAKGVDQDLARKLASQVAPPDDAMDAALGFAQRRLRSIRAGSKDDAAVRRRLAAALARRGFDPDTCRRAVDRALSSDD